MIPREKSKVTFLEGNSIKISKNNSAIHNEEMVKKHKTMQNTVKQRYNFCCKFCGEKLFKSSDIKRHPNPYAKISAEKSCKSYFVNQLDWLGYDGNSGKINCPRKTCGAKIGLFSWAGLRCNCGHHVAPAFEIYKHILK